MSSKATKVSQVKATLRAALVVAALAVTGPARAGAPGTLTLYFIDVEGGQSTLIVTPQKQAFLVDTGWAGQGIGFVPGDPKQARDANRILAAARDAGVSKIDYLLITHFHPDHDGGVSELAKLMSIGTFIDHDTPSPGAVRTGPDIEPAFEAYRALLPGHPHIVPKPGDRLAIPGVEVTVVSSDRATLSHALPGAGVPNRVCTTAPIPAADPYENPRSTGVLLTYGQFRFLDLGDLSGEPLFRLACPKSLTGPVSVYLVAHHGGPDIADTATFAEFATQVAIMNNGLKKGGAPATFRLLHHVAGLEDVWQLHVSDNAGADGNFADGFIANRDEATSYWIRLEAHEDGSFRILNPRTRQWKNYLPRAAAGPN
jgi:beta-lactamase superfamily II metal-dependent hydrolase